MTEKGKVWLAGAGPGDAGLLTVKTRQLLCEADVIVYDALVSEEILCQIPDHVERIYVGKRSGHHPVPQEEINAILLQEAQKGKRVLAIQRRRSVCLWPRRGRTGTSHSASDPL